MCPVHVVGVGEPKDTVEPLDHRGVAQRRHDGATGFESEIICVWMCSKKVSAERQRVGVEGGHHFLNMVFFWKSVEMQRKREYFSCSFGAEAVQGRGVNTGTTGRESMFEDLRPHLGRCNAEGSLCEVVFEEKMRKKIGKIEKKFRRACWKGRQG